MGAQGFDYQTRRLQTRQNNFIKFTKIDIFLDNILHFLTYSGCADKSECEVGEYCDQSHYFCRQIKCPCAVGDTGAQFEDPKVSKVFGSEAVVTCDTGMVFKTSQAIADHQGDDCNLAIAFEGQDCRKKTGTVVVFCPSQLCPYTYLAESTACGEAISHILNIQIDFICVFALF